METIKGLLEEFKTITLDIEKIVLNEETDVLEGKLASRKEIIDKLKEFDDNEVKKLFREFDLETLENKLSNIMVEKRDAFKTKLMEIKSKKQANIQYNKLYNGNARLFNKKI